MPRPKLIAGFCLVIVLGTGMWWYTSAHSGAPASPASDTIAPRVFEYVDDVFRFSVLYPADYAVREYAEDEVGARTITFESSDDEHAFQIFVVPYGEDHITPERFHIDDPSGVMKDAKEVMLDGTPAKSFFGYNDEMGDRREVWFIHGGFLYEVTTYQSLDPWLTAILQSWKFT